MLPLQHMGEAVANFELISCQMQHMQGEGRAFLYTQPRANFELISYLGYVQVTFMLHLGYT